MITIVPKDSKEKILEKLSSEILNAQTENDLSFINAFNKMDTNDLVESIRKTYPDTNSRRSKIYIMVSSILDRFEESSFTKTLNILSEISTSEIEQLQLILNLYFYLQEKSKFKAMCLDKAMQNPQFKNSFSIYRSMILEILTDFSKIQLTTDIMKKVFNQLIDIIVSNKVLLPYLSTLKSQIIDMSNEKNCSKSLTKAIVYLIDENSNLTYLSALCDSHKLKNETQVLQLALNKDIPKLLDFNFSELEEDYDEEFAYNLKKMLVAFTLWKCLTARKIVKFSDFPSLLKVRKLFNLGHV